jgi:hypothetical protein
MVVRPPEMLAAPPRTLLALDLVGPVEAEPAQLVGHLRSGVGGAEQTSDKGTPAPVGEAGTASTSGALPGRWFGYSRSVRCQPLRPQRLAPSERVGDVTLTLLIWVLLGATLALAGVIVAYIERRE